MIKQEIINLASRDRFGNEMYPGRYLLTWARTAFGWSLLSMESHQ